MVKVVSGSAVVATPTYLVNPATGVAYDPTASASTGLAQNVTIFRVKTSFTAASVGDTVVRTQFYKTSDGTTITEVTTIWYNQTTNLVLSGTPSLANLEDTTNLLAQLRDAAVDVSTPAPVTGVSIIYTATLTRPTDTTSYSIGDLVANSTTAGSVAPIPLALGRINAGTGQIYRVRLSSDKATSPTGTDVFRVHFFELSPTGIAVGDNGVFNSSGVIQCNGITARHFGQIDVTLDRLSLEGEIGVATPTSNQLFFQCGAGSKNIYALIEARTAYAPKNAGVFKLTVEAVQD